MKSLVQVPMTSEQKFTDDGRAGLTLKVIIGIIVALTALRLAGLLITPLNLGPDEAQYWRWGKEFDWGYWSKPPLIGWAIGATTRLFGDAEWAVRFMAPLSHGFGAIMLLLLGRSMFDARVGAAAALVYILMPGVTLSSAVISTDGLLLPLWSLGLLMLWRLRTGEGSWFSAVGLGVALGLGFLAKYAMIYFIVGMALALIMDRPLRQALFNLKGLIVLLIGAAIFAPHMAWNAANSFKTVSHTADNANWGGDLLNFENALKFLTDQMGVFGPITFLALLGGLIGFSQGPSAWWRQDRERFLLAFILPPLTVILIQAVISRAHANWAAAAYPAASVLVVAWLFRARGAAWIWPALAGLIFLAALTIPGLGWTFRIVFGTTLAGVILATAYGFRFRLSGLVWAAIVLHGVVGAMFTVAAISPPNVAASLGLANAFKRTRAWEETTAMLAAKAEEVGATAIMFDERENYHGLDYYGRNGFPVPIRSWRVGETAKSFAEEFTLQPGEDEIVLVASMRKNHQSEMEADFRSFTPAGQLSIDLTGGKTRVFDLFIASGYEPVPRD